MSSELSLSNLHYNVCASDLVDYFRRFGRILNVSIDCNSFGISNCKGTIIFDNPNSAVCAKREMDNSRKLGNPLKVKLVEAVEKTKSKDAIKGKGKDDAEPITKIFIKNFSTDWDELELQKAFEKFGAIKEVQVNEDDSGRSNGYGFIIFEKSSSAQKAINEMNGKFIGQKKLTVRPFVRKANRDKSIDIAREKSIVRNNLHVKNVPKDVDEDELEELFAKFGSILSVKIVRDDKMQSKGFAYVCYHSEANADSARKQMNGFTLKSSKLDISFFQKKADRKHYLHLVKSRENLN